MKNKNALSLEKIKEDALIVYNLLKDVHTVGDVRNLRHYSINEDILVDIGDGISEYDLAELDQNQPIYALRVSDGNILDTCIDYPTITSGEYYFDVFDPEYDEEYAFIEDATMKTIDELYVSAWEEYQNEEER